MNFPKVARPLGCLVRHVLPRVMAEAHLLTLRIQGDILHVREVLGSLEFLITPGKVDIAKDFLQDTIRVVVGGGLLALGVST